MTNYTNAELYQKYEDANVLDASLTLAEWTLPAIMPATFETSSTATRSMVDRDYQSFGAIITNHLASKLTTALFPTGTSFFKLYKNASVEQTLAEDGITTDQVSSKLIEIEDEATSNLMSSAGLSKLTYLMSLLIVTGNALLYRDSELRALRVYNLQNYVVRRDSSGAVVTIVIRERILREDLEAEGVDTTYLKAEDYVMYTKVQRGYVETKNGRDIIFTVTQEVDGKPVGDPIVYPHNMCPYIPVVWNLVTGEHYGRGHAEDHGGLLARLSALSYSLAKYEAEALRVINLVSPDSTIDIDALAEADCGAYVSGTRGGIEASETGATSKIRDVLSDIQSIKQELSVAFMYSGNTRDAERVTAVEIRVNAQEAELGMGGKYSMLGDNLLVPLAHILVGEVNDLLGLAISIGELKLKMTVGTSALNRSLITQRLLNAANELNLVLPVFQNAGKRFNIDKVIEVVLDGHGIDVSAISYSKEELEAMQQQEKEAMNAASPQAALDAASANLLSQQQGLT